MQRAESRAHDMLVNVNINKFNSNIAQHVARVFLKMGSDSQSYNNLCQGVIFLTLSCLTFLGIISINLYLTRGF